MPVGRPTKYTAKLADKICERLAMGESMRSISRDKKMPCMTTLFRWLRENETFKQQYAIAKEESADYLTEEMLDIADHQVGSPLLNDDGKPVLDDDGNVILVRDAPAVNHARLRVDTRKWYASKLKPKKYGDKLQQEVSGPEGAPLIPIINVSVGTESKPSS